MTHTEAEAIQADGIRLYEATAARGRAELLILWVATKSVPCPLYVCNAQVGEDCIGGPRPGSTHYVRYAVFAQKVGLK